MQVKKRSCLNYEICVEGTLGKIWLNWFEGLNIRQEIDIENGQPITILYGEITDQPALHGVLNKIRDLNLTLISVKRISPKKSTGKK